MRAGGKPNGPMNSETQSSNAFLLVGNASYQNRGCEAIVRGTVDILAEAQVTPASFTNGFYGKQEEATRQAAQETDARIHHVHLQAYPPKWSKAWFEARMNEKFGCDFSSIYAPLVDAAGASSCALEIGGDNYTLDYGFPAHLVAMDRWLMKRGKSVVIWGASIGPFSDRPEQEQAMMAHLRSLKAVFVRESATYDYLVSQHGLRNVHLFADPAFVMTPQTPARDDLSSLIEKHPLAVNMSPLLAAYRGRQRAMPWKISEASLTAWQAEAADLVVILQQKTGLPILLVPHVGSTLPGIDDFRFLRGVHQQCLARGNNEVAFVGADLNARELKWLISQCRCLVAARTHATIAAFSTGVPTISLGYSRKAVGINQDVFDTTEFCLKSNELTSGALTAKVLAMLENESAIRRHLAERGPLLRASAMAAGPKLAEVLEAGA